MFWSLNRVNSPQLSGCTGRVTAGPWHHTAEEGAAKPQIPSAPTFTSSTWNFPQPPGRAGAFNTKGNQGKPYSYTPPWAGEMAVPLQVLAAFPEGPQGLFAEPTLSGSQLPVTPFSDIHFSLLLPVGVIYQLSQAPATVTSPH